MTAHQRPSVAADLGVWQSISQKRVPDAATAATNRRRQGLLLLAMALCLALPCSTGCRRDRSGSPVDPDTIAAYGKLPGLRESHHPELRAELARLVSERATPALLTREAQLARRSAGDHNTTLEAADFACNPLADIFPADLLRRAEPRAAELVASDQFQFSDSHLEAAAQFRELLEPQRQRFRESIQQPDFTFAVRHVDGLMADLSFIDAAQLGSRLEALWAAELIGRGRPDEAIEPLVSMLRAVGLLAAESHPATRMAAAHMRAEALHLLGAIARHPHVSHDAHVRLSRLLADQLAQWPPDANAWIGDRAQGLHTYELIRDGHLLSVLRPEEIREIEREEGQKALGSVEGESLDNDELFYLNAMRTIIDSCEQPYWRRKGVFQQIRKQLEELRNTDDFPLVAARVLLTDMEMGHQVQAQDRGRCEGWALALAAALGRKRPDYEANPLTGTPYRVREQADRITVWEAGPPSDGRPIVIPIAPRPNLEARAP
jgi:hypothetical protein